MRGSVGGWGGTYAEVRGRAGGELVGRGVVADPLDGVVVLVLDHALALDRPDDHGAVRPAAREALAVALEPNAVHRVWWMGKVEEGEQEERNGENGRGNMVGA